MSSARNNRRRRKSRGRFGPLFKLLCVLTVVVAVTMGATVFFQVETVAVSGNSRYTQEEVAAASGIQTGDNLFHMNKNQVARQIRETLPYIGEVSIQRSLPSTIVISVTEWDAVARVEPPEEGRQTAAESGSGDSSAGDSSGAEDASAQEQAPEVAAEPWLISVGGKLLEPAYPGGNTLSVTGLTSLMPRAGTPLAVPQEEQPKLDALLSLLSALEKAEMLSQVSAVQLGNTRITLRYLDRFDVKLPLNGDFSYQLRVLTAAVADLNSRIGESCTGTLDLSQDQEGAQAVYSPE